MDKTVDNLYIKKLSTEKTKKTKKIYTQHQQVIHRVINNLNT